MKNKKGIRATALALALLVGASSFAYFTDKASGSFESQAGTLCLVKVKNEAELNNVAPGDSRDLMFSYKNEGKLAMDTRITYVLSHDLSEFREGEDLGVEKIVSLLEDGEVLVSKGSEADDKSVTVDGPTIQGTVDKVGDENLIKNLQMKFHEEMPNDFQDATFSLHVVIEGKQNSPEAEWGVLNTETYTIRDGEFEVVEASLCNVGLETEDGAVVFQDLDSVHDTMDSVEKAKYVLTVEVDNEEVLREDYDQFKSYTLENLKIDKAVDSEITIRINAGSNYDSARADFDNLSHIELKDGVYYIPFEIIGGDS